MTRPDKRSRSEPMTDGELAGKLREHYGMVFHYLLKVTMDRTLAEDLTQETMIRAIEKIGTYDDRFKFSTWLITIGTRLFLDQLRKSKRERRLIGHSSRMSGLQWETTARGTEWTALMASLEQLSKEERMPLVLKHYYGYTYEEIGAMMSLPSGTVKSRIHNVITKLREERDEHEANRAENRR
ncbi:sigma-70 family RNA polymerase sigma factor [Cohnella boryungensis]|uniref:RNA polymerase sigma factor n=1 Tax=Cohnella boryungensis TaxID=768479 RepID=A0ABV8SBE9_9BACL